MGTGSQCGIGEARRKLRRGLKRYNAVIDEKIIEHNSIDSVCIGYWSAVVAYANYGGKARHALVVVGLSCR